VTIRQLIRELEKISKTQGEGTECVIDCPHCGKSKPIKKFSVVVVLESEPVTTD
jgi:hypothetical protein